MKLGRSLRTILGAAPLLLLLPGASPAAASPAAGCSLPSAAGVKHVIDIQFDNVHLRRDTPNVPSDLEQMPNLLNFLQGGGALLDDHHTPLIAHTADDIITTNTGVYPNQQGQAVANSYREFTTPSQTASSSSFAYWTDTTPDGSFNMLSAAGQNAPAPWVPFTRAGCNVGSVGTANSAFESLGDVAKVYGPNSPQAQEVSSGSPNAFADFEGIAVHCAKGSGLCAGGNNGIADVLPQEPRGYTGFNALFGSKYVDPQISPGGPLTDLDGNLIADVFNGHASPGFPGFDGMSASVSLAYTAAMQEHGVPITYSYISSAHVDANGNDAGPGQADYVARLHAYDQAWGKFFARLQKDGINKSNTLFVITSDENDHFAGGQGSPAGCDGVNTPCAYSAIGEVHADLTTLLQQAGVTTPFTQHSDSAPAIYVTGEPARDAAVTRTFDRALANIEVTNPLGGTVQPLFDFLTDSVGMKLEHMVTADPSRTPTVVAWGNPDYFVDTGAADCPGGPVVECPPSFGEDAWIHGTISPDINHTWLGLVGPGVQHIGRNETIWSDHADVRPTILMLAGLKDDYQDSGRPLFEAMSSRALPDSVRDHQDELVRLAQTFKRIDASVGQLGLDGVRISTAALASGSATDDSRYTQLESQLGDITTQRDALAARMLAMIDGAAFSGRAIDEDQAENLVDQGRDLLDRVTDLANDQA